MAVWLETLRKNTKSKPKAGTLRTALGTLTVVPVESSGGRTDDRHIQTDDLHNQNQTGRPLGWFNVITGPGINLLKAGVNK